MNEEKLLDGRDLFGGNVFKIDLNIHVEEYLKLDYKFKYLTLKRVKGLAVS